MEKYLECGAITRIHGLMGALVVNHYCDSYEVFAQLKYVYIKSPDGYEKKKVKKVSPYKVGALLTLDGVTNADDAMKYRGKTIYADRNDLAKDDDSYFIVDLIGLDVIDAESGRVYGRIEGVNTNASQILYEVKTEKEIRLLPAVDAFIKEIVPEKCVYVNNIPGLLD